MSGRRASDIISLLRAITDVQAKFIKLQYRQLEVYNATSALASVTRRQLKSRQHESIGDAGNPTASAPTPSESKSFSRPPRLDGVTLEEPNPEHQSPSNHRHWNGDTRRQATLPTGFHAGIQEGGTGHQSNGLSRPSVTNSSMANISGNGLRDDSTQAQPEESRPSPVEKEARETRTRTSGSSSSAQPRSLRSATASGEGHLSAAGYKNHADNPLSATAPPDLPCDDGPASAKHISDDVYSQLFHNPRTAQEIRSSFDVHEMQHQSHPYTDSKAATVSDAIGREDFKAPGTAREKGASAISWGQDLQASALDRSNSSQMRSANPDQVSPSLRSR